MRIAWPLVLCAALALASTVAADVEPTSRELLDRAIALTRGDDRAATAVAFGRAARSAHDKSDPLIEQEIVRPLADFLVPMQAEPEALLAAITLVVTRLDARRTGAFVSVPGLGLDALYLATASGKIEDVVDTAGYVALWAGPKGREPCIAARSIGRYARALERLGSSNSAVAREAAIADLDAARRGAQQHGFQELLLSVTAELIVQLDNAGEYAKAHAALDAFSRPTWALEKQCWLDFDGILRKRLGKGAARYVSSKDDRYAGGRGKLRAVFQEGGLGGRRGRAGAMSPLGEAWSDAGDRRIVSVTRGSKGFRIRPGFARAPAATEQFAERRHTRYVGGVTVAFFGKSVAVFGLDLSGSAGRHRPSDQRESFHAFHLLADGETIAFSKESGMAFSRR